MGIYPSRPYNRKDRVEVLTAPNYDFISGSLSATDSASAKFQTYPSKFQVGLRGTWTGTIALQWTPYYTSTSPGTWYDMKYYTGNTSHVSEVAVTSAVRLIMTAVSAGTATYWLGQGM